MGWFSLCFFWMLAGCTLFKVSCFQCLQNMGVSFNVIWVYFHCVNMPTEGDGGCVCVGGSAVGYVNMFFITLLNYRQEGFWLPLKFISTSINWIKLHILSLAASCFMDEAVYCHFRCGIAKALASALRCHVPVPRHDGSFLSNSSKNPRQLVFNTWKSLAARSPAPHCHEGYNKTLWLWTQ